MWLLLATPASDQPVSLAEAKAHLRVTNSAEDDMITGLVAAATAHLEGRNGILGRALLTQTWEMRIDAFPTRAGGRIELPFPPLQSVAWIKYLDSNGTEQTIDPALYSVDAQHMVGRVRPAYGQSWPATLADDGAVRIRFVAGYGTAAAVPQALKQAILLLVGHWWMNREAVGQAGGPQALAVEALTSPYRVHAS